MRLTITNYYCYAAMLSYTTLVEGFSFLPNTNTPHMVHGMEMRRSSPQSLKMVTGVFQDSNKRAAPAVTDPANIRNVAVVGHSHSGKTALVEWMLYDENIITKRPMSGVSLLDSDPVEAIRHSSVFSHFARVPHGNFLLEVADTPWGDFPSDALASLDGADSAVIVVSAADGVKAGTMNAFQHCQDTGIRSIVAISKMDRDILQLDEIMLDIEEKVGMKPVPLEVPVFSSTTFQGVHPLFALAEDGSLTINTNTQVDGFEEAWMTLEEAVAMTDDDLLVEYLENSCLQPDQIFTHFRSAVRSGKILPLVYTSAEQDQGVLELMDAIVGVLPNPVEMRQEAIRAACESDKGRCGLIPGVETGFAARVLHTTVDSFGSLSVLRIISNSRDDHSYHPLPHEAVVLRNGLKIKMPSATASFGLCGKERLPLSDETGIVPGDVIAVPKLSEDVRTHDILTIESALVEEESLISIETDSNFLTPLSRPVENIALMASATVSLFDASGGTKKGKGKASSSGDDKLLTCLKALAREDLAMKVEHDPSGMLLLRCMNGDHLHLVAARLNDRYGLQVELGKPRVPYRETLSKAVREVEGRHKKQSGGSGQFGVCYITMEPLAEGAGVEFVSKIKGGAISKPFISSVEKGVREQLQSGGPLAGYPVTDVRVTLTDGKMHSVDSKDIAFQSAGKLAVKTALEKGGSCLLQPMEKVRFIINENLQGEINAMVSRQEGYVTGMDASSDAGESVVAIEAILPTAAISEISDILRAKSAGEGTYSTEFSHYQHVTDPSLIETIVKDSPYNQKLSP